MKKIRFELTLNEIQNNEVVEKSKLLGFSNKSDYIRYLIFIQSTLIEKIDVIYKRVCKW